MWGFLDVKNIYLHFRTLLIRVSRTPGGLLHHFKRAAGRWIFPGIGNGIGSDSDIPSVEECGSLQRSPATMADCWVSRIQNYHGCSTMVHTLTHAQLKERRAETNTIIYRRRVFFHASRSRTPGSRGSAPAGPWLEPQNPLGSCPVRARDSDFHSLFTPATVTHGFSLFPPKLPVKTIINLSSRVNGCVRVNTNNLDLPGRIFFWQGPFSEPFLRIKLWPFVNVFSYGHVEGVLRTSFQSYF